MAIVPVAKGLYLCERYIGYSDAKVDLYGLFNAIRPKKGFPDSLSRFCVFAQLINGLGHVPFFIDIRFAETDELVHVTQTNTVNFPDRHTTLHMALKIEGCRFPRQGLYILDLFCDNTWVCDAQLLLLELEGTT